MNEELGQSFTQEEIDAVKQIQAGYANNTAQVGQVEVELYLLRKRLSEIESLRTSLFETYESLQEQERNLVEILNKKYGDGVLDLDSGKFIPTSK
jgi:dsDNA-specific endonuclease/ATPase MutS2